MLNINDCVSERSEESKLVLSSRQQQAGEIALSKKQHGAGS